MVALILQLWQMLVSSWLYGRVLPVADGVAVIVADEVAKAAVAQMTLP